MKIAIIGRGQWLYNTARLLLEHGYKIPLIITAKEAPEYSITAKDFQSLSENIGASYLYTPRIDLQKCSEAIKKTGTIDVAVSINYTGVIPQNVIDLFSLGILNGHMGDLPRYRGNAPLAWAIINKESKVALCIHKMIGGELDSGDIICKEYKEININTRIGELFHWFENRTPYLMLQAIKILEQDPNYKGEVQSKDPQKALRCYPRIPEDGKIDWNMSNEDVLRLINASSEPFMGAFCKYENEQLTIWRAELEKNDEQYCAIPGQVSKIESSGEITVLTGNGKLKITEVEYRGIRTQPATFIKSIRKRLM